VSSPGQPEASDSPKESPRRSPTDAPRRLRADAGALPPLLVMPDGGTDIVWNLGDDAIGRMVAHAQHLGANAVINVRLTTSSVSSGAAELYAYGTAVVLEQA
jgi:hypothetical protein